MNKLLSGLILLVIPMLAGASARPDNTGGDAQDIANGRQVYEQYCAACHGAQGEGAANWKKRDNKGEMPAPPHNETGHTWRHSDDRLFGIIANGQRHPFNKTDRLTMPAFGTRLTDQEIRAVINYLKTLWTDEQRKFQATESQ